MLGKLIKYEFKATKRIMIPAIIALICVSVVNGILLGFATNKVLHDSIVFNTFSAASIFIYAFGIMAILVLAGILSIFRFYKSDLSNEGYLTHTLPVNISKEIISKVSVGTLWVILAGCAIIISLLLISSFQMFFNLNGLTLSDLSEVIDKIIYVLKNNWGDLIIGFVYVALILVLSCSNEILSVYSSMAVGFSFSKNKIALSFLAYIAINTVTMIIFVLLGNVFSSFHIFEFLEKSISTALMPHLVCIGCIALLVILNVAYFFIIKFFFDRKLNLE